MKNKTKEKLSLSKTKTKIQEGLFWNFVGKFVLGSNMDKFWNEIPEEDKHNLKKLKQDFDTLKPQLRKLKKWALAERPDGLTNYEYFVSKGWLRPGLNWDNV
jgi:hypothetical protein